MKIRSILIKITFLALSLCLVAGCQHGSVLIVWNNTGSEIALSKFDALGQMKVYKVPDHKSEVIGNFERLTVQTDATIWEYGRIVNHYSQFMRKRRILPNAWIFHIERDGSIYLLPPDTTAVTTNLPIQPPGFPLKPTN